MNEKLFNTPHTHTTAEISKLSINILLRSSRFSILLLVSIFSIFPHFHERTRTECCCLWILMSCGRTSRKQAVRWRGRKSTKFIPTVAIQSISHPANAIFIQHLIIISVNVAHGAVSEATHHLGCLEHRALPPRCHIRRHLIPCDCLSSEPCTLRKWPFIRNKWDVRGQDSAGVLHPPPARYLSHQMSITAGESEERDARGPSN